MKRLIATLVNFVFLIVGFLSIYVDPASSVIVTIGMILISFSIISFTVMIYFPPSQPEYVSFRPAVKSVKRSFVSKRTKKRVKGPKKANRRSKKSRKR